MRSILVALLLAISCSSLLAQGAEPMTFVFVTDVDVAWHEGKAVMDLHLFGNRVASHRDSVCKMSPTDVLVVDTEGVRIKVEDAEGRKCEVDRIEMGETLENSTGRLLTNATITFLADDGGAPRLPIRGWFSFRLHETPPTCTDVDEHIVHMMRFQIDSQRSGAVKNYSDHYMGVSQED